MKKIIGKRGIAVLLVFAIAAMGVVMGCKGGTDPTPPVVEPEPTPPITVTKDVSVGFPVYSSGGTSISFAPTYSPDGGSWGEHFSATDITYTVTATCTGVNRTYDSTSGFIANISDGYTGGMYAFTQTFKMGGTVVGSQTIKADVFLGNFGVLTDASDASLSPQAIPPVSLTLSKKVQP